MVVLDPLLPKQEEELPAIFIEMARNEDGAVEVPAELVVAESLPPEARVIALPGVGIERVVAKVFKGAAMEVARTALRNHADLAARCAAVLCRIAGGQDLYLRGGIDIGDANAGAVGTRAHHRRAVERLQALLAARAVHIEGVIKAKAKGRHRIVAHDAGLHLCEKKRVASIELNRLDLLLGDELADRGALGLHGVDACFDTDFGGGVTNSHGDVDVAADARIEVHVGKCCGLKTGDLDTDTVVARGKVGECKATALVTGNGTIGVGCVAVNRDFGVRKERTRCVSDSTGEG